MAKKTEYWRFLGKQKLFENSWVYFVRPLRPMEVLQVLRAGHCCEYSMQGRLRKNKYHIKQKPWT